MALSGSIKRHFSGNGNYWIKGNWTATQDITNNRSTITLKTYFGSNSSWSLYGNNLRLTTWINSVSANTKHNISTSGGREILINTRTITINHNADGTKNFNLHLIMDATMITISGRNLGKADTGNTVQTLNTIPRKSTLSSASSLTAPNDYALSISRASSSFTHTVRFTFGGLYIGEINNVATTATVYWSQAQRELLVRAVRGVDAVGGTIEVITYNGGTHIGTNTYNATLYHTPATGLDYSSAVNIGETLNIGLFPYKDYFTHTIYVIFEGYEVKLTDKALGTYFTWETASIKDALYARIPNSLSGVGRIDLYTFCGSEEIGFKSVNFGGYVNTYESSPLLPSDPVAYQDISGRTINITGNNQYIISKQSLLQVNLKKLGTLRNHATLREYSVMIGGVRKVSPNNSIQDFNMGQVNVRSGDSITLTITDSRGLSTSTNIPCTILDYDSPNLNIKVERFSNFETTSKITLLCDYSPLIVSGVGKNVIREMKYRYRKQGESVWSGYISLPFTSVNDRQVRAERDIELDNNFDFEVEGYVIDTLDSIRTSTTQVSKGIPILFMDTLKKSIGIGGFPARAEVLESIYPIVSPQQIITDWNNRVEGENVNTYYYANRNEFHTTVSSLRPTVWRMRYMTIQPDSISVKDHVDVRGNIVSGVNMIAEGNTMSKHDTAIGYGSNREAWIQTKTLPNGAIVTSTRTNYNTEELAYNGNKELWVGVAHMGADHTINLPINIKDCPTGICLVWSAYSSGTARDYQFTMTYFPKAFLWLFGDGKGCNQIVAGGYGTGDASNQIHKYIYFHNNYLVGHNSNTMDAKQNSIVLRAVLVY